MDFKYNEQLEGDQPPQGFQELNTEGPSPSLSPNY